MLSQETKTLSSGKISAREVLNEVRYLRLPLFLADQGPHAVLQEGVKKTEVWILTATLTFCQ